MKIRIKTIPHKDQKYPTVGDYYMDGDELVIVVSRMKSRKHEFLVALHELIEATLCGERGISFDDITEFDKRFEAERATGLRSDDEEPGFDPNAPYLREHAFATRIERMMAKELGVNWNTYANEVARL